MISKLEYITIIRLFNILAVWKNSMPFSIKHCIVQINIWPSNKWSIRCYSKGGLSRFSFKYGFHNKLHYPFSGADIQKINNCWQ